MSQPVIQTSFNAGEWAPALNARVDLAKYHSGAALLRNFFVDYRGGATTRPGSKYILQAKSTGTVRLIPFQASFTVAYMLEFGAGYIRFYTNGAIVLEAPKIITNVTKANPGVVTSAAHGYSNDDWVQISGIGGMTQLNGNFYIVANVTVNTYTLKTLTGAAVDTSSFGAFTSNGQAQRVYTVATTYTDSEITGIKYAQNVNTLVLCHPNHQPSQLVLNTNSVQPNWSFSSISFIPSIAAPSVNSLVTTLPGGSAFVSYKVTAVDVNGQESIPVGPVSLSNVAFNTAAGTSTIVMNTPLPTGTVSLNLYRSNYSLAGIPPGGIQYGFVGNFTGTTLFDSDLGADFSQGIPIAQNPFSGASVSQFNLTAGGTNWTSVPTPVFTAAPAGGTTATGTVGMVSFGVTLNFGGTGYVGGDILAGPLGMSIQVLTIGPGGVISTFQVNSQATAISGAVPVGFNAPILRGGTAAIFGFNWTLTNPQLVSAGSGYLVAPSVTFSGGGGFGATASTVLGAASSGNPTVPAFIQQRMFLGGPVSSPSQFNFSQPGYQYNFNTTFPVQADNAIQATLTNTTLNSIKSAVPVSAGLIVFTDKGAWLLNGGTPGSAISALSLVANPQAYSGANDVPPIVTPSDILYVQAKGSVVRDLAFNFYLNNYVGVDISILSSHLFYGFQITQWAWAEEPFKTVWAVRSDGDLLSLAFIKDQELVAWAHHDTQGLYQSVATVTESTSTAGNVDAVYTVVQRTINGNVLNYVERFVELTWPQDYRSSWQVDAGIQYSGSPATSFSGAQHLAGAAITGVADGVVFTATVSATGTFTLANAASLVTAGLAFTPQIQTLRLDLGEPTVQGKRKKISAVTLRLANALGLSIGNTFSTLVAMKDLVLGNVGSMSNTVVSGLVTEDARTIIDNNWTVQGQVCVQQNNPYPASVLGVIPEIEVGDTTK